MTLFNPGQAASQPQTQFSNAGSVTEFALSATPTTIVPDRTTAKNRRGFSIYNDGTSNALFAYGTSVSPSLFTAEILPGGYFEDSSAFPWQGPVVGRSTNNPTTVNVTEMVVII